MFERNPWDWAASILTSVGAINWGLLSFSNFNLVEAIFGEDTMMTQVIYGLVGIAGLWNAYQLYQGYQMRNRPMVRTRQNIFTMFGGR